eukprot:2209950-Prorocentrum_lima.AAC.1
MTSSLVGSEMCIRDRAWSPPGCAPLMNPVGANGFVPRDLGMRELLGGRLGGLAVPGAGLASTSRRRRLPVVAAA